MKGGALKILIIIIYALILSNEQAKANVGATGFQCEYLTNPIGIDAVHPRLTWRLNDKRQDATQTAYHLLISTDSLALLNGTGDMWDTGWVKSPTNLIIYAGAPLKPFTRYYWKVDVADKDQIQHAGYKISFFETGMMQISNWQGAWITDIDDVNLKPAPYFRKVFDARKNIRSARAYIACAGLYELYINGKKTGNHRLDPMYTRFDKRTLYVTYDVTSQLQSGKNAIGVLLGNGWYNMQSTAVWDFDKAKWRARPTFCLNLRITYEDGTIETITTGQDWKTALSPVTFNSIYTAEHDDARLEKQGWNTANFNDSAWKNALIREKPSANIVAQAMVPIRNVEKIKVKTLTQLNDTTYVFDLGRNISGVSQLTVDGAAGTVVRLRHAERLYPDGHTDQSNISVHYRPKGNTDPFQTDIYILNGHGTETFMPHFNYKGFQYIEVTCSKPVKLSKNSLVGYFMHSDVQRVGWIKSSDPLIDKIWYATNNSYLSNLFGYPTDCPQREKNGWTGDAAIAAETGLYGFDGITVYEKWMADHRDEQLANGVLPSIIPTDGWGYEWGNGPDWTSTIAIIPWDIYLFYGDSHVLSVNYDNIKRYVNHIDSIAPSGITTWGLGDWVPVKSVTPVEFTSTCYYFTDVKILANAALLFGNKTDFEKYNALAIKIKDAFNKKYLNTNTGIYATGLQTELSVPLYWGLVPEDMKSKVAGNLAKRVEEDQFHLDVGILGQKAILNALSENGYADVAYKIASQKTYPSWGWWIENGATTLYENWKIDSKSDISLNHIMFGEIGAWLYKGIGGIRPDPARPGFKNILLSPNFVDGLDHFEAKHNGPYGEIISSWVRKGEVIDYEVTIPANSTATVTLPVVAAKQAFSKGIVQHDNVVKLAAGRYKFEWK